MQIDTTKCSVAAGRCPHPHTRAAPCAVGPRPPRSCTEGAPSLRLSCTPPQPAGRPGGGAGRPQGGLCPQGGLSPGSLFTVKGQSHTCPHQAHSPQARHTALHTPVTWGRARTPSHGAQHSPRWPGVKPHPSVPPRGLNTGTRTDGTPPLPGSIGDQGKGGGRSL